MIAFFLFILGVLVIVAGGIIGLRKHFDGDHTTSPGLTGGAVTTISIILGIGIIILGSGFREIGPGQVGVRVFFGQVQGGTLSPGLRWVVPFAESITIFDGRVQAYNFENIEGATKDLQAVGLSGLINFHIDATQADRILQEIGGPEEYAQKVFLRPSNTALKEITPRFNASEVIAKRDEIGRLTLESLRARMEEFHILVDRVSVENISLNAQFLASVEAKQIAEQDELRAAFEADRSIRLAQGEAEAAIERARGQAESNRLVNASLTEQLLQWQAIQRLSDKIRVMMVPSDQGLIIDLKGLQDESTNP